MKIPHIGKGTWIYPVILLLLCFTAYGLNVRRMGFYWDDWQVVYLSRFSNVIEYWNYFLFDRPFSAWTYILTVPILGMTPIRWQIFTILLRWATSLAFCEVLLGLWPARRWLICWMGIFFAVYPGFMQQSISVAYSQHFITYLLFNLSLAFMIWGFIHKRHYFVFTLLGLIGCLMHLFTLEYFIGLELLRPVMLWFLSTRQEGNLSLPSRMKQVLLHWLPYLLILVAFLIWRIHFYGKVSSENAPALLGPLNYESIRLAGQFAQMGLQDFLQVVFTAWANSFSPVMLQSRSLFAFIMAGFSAAAVGFLFYYLSKVKNSTSYPPETHQDGFVLQSLIIGVLAVFLGGAPVWITNRQIVSTGLWTDRFTLAPMFGAVILVACFADWFVQQIRRKTFLLSVFLGVALFSQILTTEKYASNWEVQRGFFWQLAWRVPELKSGTAIIAPKLPVSYLSDYAVGYGLNAMFDAKPVSYQPTTWFFIGPRSRGTNFRDYIDDLPAEYQLRNVRFTGSTSDFLGVTFITGRDCLRVLDPIYQDSPPLLEGDLAGIEKELFTVSHPDRIILGAGKTAPLSIKVFGSEPIHDWCYTFQKSDLARQSGDWLTIASLGDEAASKAIRTKQGFELLPFIEGYAHVNRWQDAQRLSLDADRLTAMMRPVLCSTWKRILFSTGKSAGRDVALAEISNRLDCKFE